MNANGGGIHAGTDGSVTIDGTSINRNSIDVRDPNGRPYAFDSALMTGNGTLALRNSRIQGNRVFADVGSSKEVGFSGGAIDIYGPLDGLAHRGHGQRRGRQEPRRPGGRQRRVLLWRG